MPATARVVSDGNKRMLATRGQLEMREGRFVAEVHITCKKTCRTPPQETESITQIASTFAPTNGAAKQHKHAEPGEQGMYLLGPRPLFPLQLSFEQRWHVVSRVGRSARPPVPIEHAEKMAPLHHHSQRQSWTRRASLPAPALHKMDAQLSTNACTDPIV
eukprot:1572911-Rhodomonas_salina.1